MAIPDYANNLQTSVIFCNMTEALTERRKPSLAIEIEIQHHTLTLKYLCTCSRDPFVFNMPSICFINYREVTNNTQHCIHELPSLPSSFPFEAVAAVPTVVVSAIVSAVVPVIVPAVVPAVVPAIVPAVFSAVAVAIPVAIPVVNNKTSLPQPIHGLKKI